MFKLFDPANPADPTDPYRGMRGAANLGTNAFMIIYILVNSVQAGLAAILGGPLLFALTKFVDWDTSLRLGRAWSTAFVAYFGFFCISTLLTMAPTTPPTGDLFSAEMLTHIAVLQGPPVLVASLIVMWRLPAYRGIFGFLRAVFFVCTSLVISAAMIYLTLARFAADGAPGIGFAEGLAMLGILTLVIVVPGSIVAALVIWLSTLLGPKPDEPLRFRSIFWSAILVLLAFVASVSAFEFLFMTAEEMFSWYQAYSAAADPAAYAEAHQFEYRLIIGVAASMIAISLLIAGSVLCSRLAAVFPGRIGWLHAVVTTGVAVIGALAPITALMLWAYAVGGFDDMAMYW